MSLDAVSIDFHFDPMCPFAYQTSVWMREVRRQSDLTINWRFFSLEEINLVEGKKHPWQRDWSYGWSLMRIGALLRRQDMDLLDRWYELIGRELHEEGQSPHAPDNARRLLAQIGADDSVFEQALSDDTTHDEVKADHDRVVAAGGFGVPTLFFADDAAFFGPVLINPPRDDAAMQLWEIVTKMQKFPHVYEMQRLKSPSDQQEIHESLAPYLRGRDWVSMNRGSVIEFKENAHG